jgi:hypothetical protein
MFTGARFPDSCNGTSNPVQQMTVNVLADLGSHQEYISLALGLIDVLPIGTTTKQKLSM